MGRLFTSEDRFHVHKTLGALSVLSFVYRYMWVWPRTGALGLGSYDALSKCTMLVHVSLSLSSLMFRVPLKRIHRRPTMIWEEYRMHAVVFTLRCLVVYVPQAYLYRVVCVCLVHLLADYVTAVFGCPGVTTVRGDVSRPPKMPVVHRMTVVYGMYQFLAMGSHLAPGTLGADLGYNALIGIQSSAFCMTLHRKGFITWRTHALVYSLCIGVSSLFIILRVPRIIVPVLLAYACRTRFGASKYVVWLVYVLILTFYAHALGEPGNWDALWSA